MWPVHVCRRARRGEGEGLQCPTRDAQSVHEDEDEADGMISTVPLHQHREGDPAPLTTAPILQKIEEVVGERM